MDTRDESRRRWVLRRCGHGTPESRELAIGLYGTNPPLELSIPLRGQHVDTDAETFRFAQALVDDANLGARVPRGTPEGRCVDGY